MKAYYRDPTTTLYLGDCREILASLPAESVQMVVTSPPFWGLRDYQIEPVVWGGDQDPGHEHEWVGKGLISDRRGVETIQGKSRTTKRFYGGDPTRTWSEEHQKHWQDTFCSLCGAWRGSLGLEPTPELYLEHLVEIFREVRRVLRKDGTCWMGTTRMARRCGPSG